MTKKEEQEYEDLEKMLFQNPNILRFLELYIIDRTENIQEFKLAGRDPAEERIKLEGIGELRKILSQEMEE